LADAVRTVVLRAALVRRRPVDGRDVSRDRPA